MGLSVLYEPHTFEPLRAAGSRPYGSHTVCLCNGSFLTALFYNPYSRFTRFLVTSSAIPPQTRVSSIT